MKRAGPRELTGSNQLMQRSVIDAVAPDAPNLRVDSARHAGHRRRAASRVEAHRSHLTGQTTRYARPLTGARIRTKQT